MKKMNRYVVFIATILVVSVMSFLFGLQAAQIVPNHDNKVSEPDLPQAKLNYDIIDSKLEIETQNIHVNIKYPNIVFNDLQRDTQRINQLLTPKEIQDFYDMIGEYIKISNIGELVYDNVEPFEYLNIKTSYTMGLANNDFLNLYVRSVSDNGRSYWDYRTRWIDINSNKEIFPFEAAAFKKYIIEGAFTSNKAGFNIKDYFKDVPEDDLNSYLSNAYINKNKQVEVIVIYGEGPETIIYADVDKVMGMIKPEYRKMIY